MSWLKQNQRLQGLPILGSFFALLATFWICFCGSDQNKSKKNPQQPSPPVTAGDPVKPPEDWDGMVDWTGSAFKIVEEP